MVRNEGCIIERWWGKGRGPKGLGLKQGADDIAVSATARQGQHRGALGVADVRVGAALAQELHHGRRGCFTRHDERGLATRDDGVGRDPLVEQFGHLRLGLGYRRRMEQQGMRRRLS